MGLLINEVKAKYVIMSRNQEDVAKLKFEYFVFEQVEDFDYLEVSINYINYMHS